MNTTINRKAKERLSHSSLFTFHFSFFKETGDKESGVSRLLLSPVSCLLSPVSLLLTTVSLLLASCVSDRKTFLIEGDFKGFNQGELYIYGMGGSHEIDTISVAKGHFRYEITLEDTVTLNLVFPNFSELPVFAQPRAEVEIEGDASHLKETKISGTKENEDMTAFRLKTSGMTPPQVVEAAAAYIKEQPASPISLYLLHKYFTQSPTPDYRQAVQLATIVSRAVPNEPSLKGVVRRLKGIGGLKDGSPLPSFTTTDLSGRTVKSSDLNARLNLITVWAKWNYESTSLQRQLIPIQQRHGDKLKILSISIDASVKECRQSVERDSLKWSTVCDGRMWETPLLTELGLCYVPDNILTDSHGTIIAHGLKARDLQMKIDQLLTDKSD